MESSVVVEELEAGIFDSVSSFFVNYGWATVALIIIVGCCGYKPNKCATDPCETSPILQVFSAKPYVEGAYNNYLQRKSYEEAVNPDRVSVLDEQRARAFAAREAALLKEAEERKQELKELKKKREAEGKSLRPIEPREFFPCTIKQHSYLLRLLLPRHFEY